LTPQERAATARDLIYFRKWLDLRAWTDAPPAEEIRHGSLLLRRLLLDRELVRAWQAAGFPKEPRVIAVDLAATIAAQGPGTPEFALAGSARNTAATAEGVPVRKETANRPGSLVRTWALSQYLESPSIFLGQVGIKRREVVKYVAMLNGAGEAASAKGRRQEQEFAAGMDRLEKRANAFRPNTFQIELFSIGQTVGQTPDTLALIDALSA